MAAREMQGAAERSVGQYGADELKNLLAHIADQIIDVDRRHTEVLRQMHERMALLGQEACSVRSQGIDKMFGSFDQIEDSMAMLAERVAEIRNEVSARGAPIAAPPVAAQPVVAPSVEAPMALKSAASTHVRAEPVRRGVIDNFEVHESSRPGDDAYPWDEVAAEALMRLHESGETAFVRRTPDPEAVRPAPAAASTPAASIAPVASVAPVAPVALHTPVAALAPVGVVQPAVVETHRPQADFDKLWLEEKMSDLARRLQQSISDLRPDSSVQALGERLNVFEERLAAAFDGVATRADMESLGLIDTNIGELAGYLDSAQAQLARLDTIESQLQSVMDRLSGDRLTQIMPAGAPLQTSSPAELERVALSAAAQVASQVQDLVSQLPVDHSAPEIRVILDRFMEERRLGEEQVVAILDTMQQALISVLDRMDTIEMAQQVAAPVSAAATASGSAAADPALQPPPQPASIYAATGNSDYSDPAPPAAAIADTALALAAQAVFHSTRVETPLEGPQPGRVEVAASIPASSVPDRLSPVSIDRIRQDLRADAQRARAKATSEASETAAVNIQGSAKAAARKLAGGKLAFDELSNSGSFLGGKRRWLVGALALAVAIMGGKLLMPKGNGTAKPAASKIEQSVNPTVKDSKSITAAPSPGSETNSGAGVEGQDSVPAEPSVAPNAPPAKKHTAPVTMNDGLGMGEEIPDNTKPAANSAPAAQASTDEVMSPFGTPMQNPLKAPLAPDLFKADSGVPAAPTALTKGSETVPPSAGARSSNLDLPPVTVGPLSLRLAAAKGDPSAEFEVAVRLAEGKGTSQNFKEAMRWYQRSAARGFAQAQYRLGTLYERGLGAPMDMGRARIWYQRAAEQGNVKSMHNLAVLSAGRENGTPDYPAAARWFRAAAERNLADSQFNIGVLLESGLGVEKDFKQAFMWFTLAAAGGDKEAAHRRELLRSQLAPADLAAAEAMAKAFVPLSSDQIVNDARAAGEDWKKRQATDSNG